MATVNEQAAPGSTPKTTIVYLAAECRGVAIINFQLVGAKINHPGTTQVAYSLIPALRDIERAVDND